MDRHTRGGRGEWHPRLHHRPRFAGDPDPYRATTPERLRAFENTEQFLEQAAASDFDFHRVSVKAAGDEKLKRAPDRAQAIQKR